MSELALYRKYRSANFDAVIGQPHVVETLTHAIAANRLSHAYLFTGPRGVGKTSVARLLARAANCTAEDPAKRPCGQCDNCKVEIGGHLDLIEIDAASNRGIDDARALREKITSAPSLGKYKVFIIDEVHMLTTEAFNALLKTLEEPPAHAMFILATTEAHKLPETIISRTQRFTFKPISQTNIIDHLRYIADNEGIEADDGALALIAHASRGGFRDAISLLDQAAASGVKPLTATEVRKLLGQSDPELLHNIALAIQNRQAGVVLGALDTALDQGIQPTQLAVQLLDYWRIRLHELVKNQPQDPGSIHQAVVAIERLMPVAKSHWPEISLEAALVELANGSQSAPVQQVAPATTARAATPTKPATSATTKPPQPTPQQTPSGSEGTDEELWVKSLTLIKQKNNSLYALLRSSTTVRFDGDEVILGCRFSFHRDRLKETKNLQIIEKALARVYGRKFKVSPQLEAKPAVTVPAADSSSELISSALEILGGEVVHE